MAKTLGILGGGQLGRMSAQAAKELDIKTVIYTPEKDSPASQVADETIVAAYDDEEALTGFADKVEVISYEFENIPVETVQLLNKLKPVYPDERLLEVSQDRICEKSFLNDTGIPTTRWHAPQNPDEIRRALENWGTETCILKTVRFGYDGKGQLRLKGLSGIEKIWDQFYGQPVIMEEIVDFTCEISVIIARDKEGKSVTYGPALNEHKNHILDTSTVPAGIPAAVSEEAVALAIKLAEAVNLRGVLGLEMFVTKDNRLLANEIAPRTHNSGHWSIDACEVSQFSNHVRTVCGLEAANPGCHSDCVMINLIGKDILDIDTYEDQENAHLHLYGKKDIREGRKMGHVTILK